MFDEPIKLSAVSDMVFQYTFSSEGSEKCLLPFINAVLESSGRTPVVSVKIENPFNIQKYLNSKKTILDIKVKDANGRAFDIEMQTCNEVGFPERILYYWSQLYVDQIQSGQDYVEIQPVISIVLTRFTLFKELPDLHNVFNIRSEKNRDFVLTPNLEIHTLELTETKWKRFLEGMMLENQTEEMKKQEALKNWLDYFLHSHRKTEEEMRQLVAETQGMDVAFHKFTDFQKDTYMRDMARAMERTARDERGRLLFAQKEGLEKGLAEGRAEGRAEALVDSISKFYPFVYSEEISPEFQNRLLQIQDCGRLDVIMSAMLARKPLEEVQKYL